MEMVFGVRLEHNVLRKTIIRTVVIELKQFRFEIKFTSKKKIKWKSSKRIIQECLLEFVMK